MIKNVAIVALVFFITSCCPCSKARLDLGRLDKDLPITLAVTTNKRIYETSETIVLTMKNNVTLPIALFEKGTGIDLFYYDDGDASWHEIELGDDQRETVVVQPGELKEISHGKPPVVMGKTLKYRVEYRFESVQKKSMSEQFYYTDSNEFTVKEMGPYDKAQNEN